MNANPVRAVLMLAMSLVYVSAGIVLLSTEVLADTIARHRPVFGGVLLGYGLLRLVIWWTKHRRHTATDHDTP